MINVLICVERQERVGTAAEVASALSQPVAARGFSMSIAPLSSGGLGFLEAFEGRTRRSSVQGPLGELVEAAWLVDHKTAILETAQVCGLSLLGDQENDPLRASTTGVGQMIRNALDANVNRIIVGLGGSASTDGGLACVSALEPLARLRGIELIVACDVAITFLAAARNFAADKGATPAQVTLLERRLASVAEIYDERFEVDVRHVAGGGAGGGLGGGLFAIGASLQNGFRVVAEECGLGEQINEADVVVVNASFIDADSFRDGVIAGVVELCLETSKPLIVVTPEVHDAREIEDFLETFDPTKLIYIAPPSYSVERGASCNEVLKAMQVSLADAFDTLSY